MAISPLKQNILANYLGGGWTAVMSLVFIPLYLHFLGIEAYGLIGMFGALRGTFSILDLGLGATLHRELARLSAQPDKAGEMRQLLRTVEVIYWALAVAIGAIVLFLAPFLAHRWVHPEKLTPATVQQAFMIMGLLLACQWPLGLYSGALMGLQRQVSLNVINIIAATLSGAGAVLLLWLVSPTIQAFFIWQIAIGASQTLAVAWWLRRSLPAGGPPARFHLQVLQGIWRFAAGMSGIGVTVLILMQLDKVILSKLLTLEMFGYYTLAGTAAGSLSRLTSPIFAAIYPRFTQLVSLGDQAGLTEIYHRSCQLMSVLILPATLVVALFSRELLLLWTRNPVTVEHTHLLLSILVIGTALNGLMNMPYALQLAYGWTRLALFTNIVSIIILVPLFFLFTSWYGAVGAALVWVMLNSGYVLISLQIMHRRLLQDEMWHWYVRDVSFPLAASLIIAGLGRLCMGGQMSQFMTLIYLIIVSISALGVTAITTPTTRKWFFVKISNLKLAYRI